MQHHDLGAGLERLPVLDVELVGLAGGGHEGAELVHEEAAVGGGEGLVLLQPLVELDDELGQRPEPGKPGVVRGELEQGEAVLHPPVQALVAAALVLQQRLVHPHQVEAQAVEVIGVGRGGHRVASVDPGRCVLQSIGKTRRAEPS